MPQMARKASDELKNRFLPEPDFWGQGGLALDKGLVGFGQGFSVFFL